MNSKADSYDQRIMRLEDRGQSEIIGVILLVGIVVTVLFVVSLMVVPNNVSDDSKPLVSIDAEATTQNVTIWHAGGEKMDVENLEVILRGDNEERYDFQTWTQLQGTDNTSFDPGDKWYRTHGIDADTMDILLVNVEANTILDSTTVDVVETLASRFNTNVANPTVQDTIKFDASDSRAPDGTIANYTWDFDDGTTLTTTDVTDNHSFDQSGDYDVSLTVTTTDGREATLTKQIAVSPLVTFTVDPQNPFEKDNVTFDASGSDAGTAQIEQYEWDFGDGSINTPTAETVTHSYATSGSYFVSLTVNDSNDNTATVSKRIDVREEVENLQLNADPNTAGADAVHNWTFDNVSFDGEVDTITLQYGADVAFNTTALEFDGTSSSEGEDIEVFFTNGDGSIGHIGVNSGGSEFETGKATLNLNGSFNRTILRSGYVRINGSAGGLTNPNSTGTYDANVTFEGEDTATGETLFTIEEAQTDLSLAAERSTILVDEQNNITVSVEDDTGTASNESVSITVGSGNGTFDNGYDNVTVQTGDDGKAVVNYTAVNNDSNTTVQIDGELETDASVNDSTEFNVSAGTGAFSGVVENATGVPITETTVTFSAEGDVFNETVETNSTGGYTVEEIPAATYNITATADRYQTDTVTNVEILENETEAGVNFTLLNEVENLSLSVSPQTTGSDAVHNWTFDDVDFGENQNGDEVDTIKVDYSGTNVSFNGLNGADITVVLTRETDDGEDTSEISVDSDSYNGEVATFNLSGMETSVVGEGYVKIDGLENPPDAGDYDANITFDGVPETVSAEAAFSVTDTSLSKESITDIVPNANEQDQRIRFTVEGFLPSGEGVEINVTEPENNGVDYLSNAEATAVNGSGSASIDQTGGSSIISYTAGPGGDANGTEIVLRVRDIAVDSQSQEHNVTFNRTGSDVQPTEQTFETARGSGDPDLSVDLEDIRPDSSEQTLTLTPDNGNAFEDSERVAIELADPHGDTAAAAPKVTYQNATVEGSGTGQVVSFNETDNGDTVYVIYGAPSTNAADLDEVNLSLDIESTDLGSQNQADFDVGVSRESADTAGATFTLTKPAFFDVNITGTNSPVKEDENLTVDVNVTNTGGLTDTQTLALRDNGTSFSDELRDNKSVELAPGNSTNVTLNWSTSNGDAGTDFVNVTSENSSDGVNVTVNPTLPANAVAFDDSDNDGVYDSNEDLYTNTNISEDNLDGVDLVIERNLSTDKIEQTKLDNLTIKDGVRVETTSGESKFTIDNADGSINASGAILAADNSAIELTTDKDSSSIDIRNTRADSGGVIDILSNGVINASGATLTSAGGSNIELETENTGDDIDISNATVNSTKKIIGTSQGSIDAQGATLTTADGSRVELETGNTGDDIDISNATVDSTDSIRVTSQGSIDAQGANLTTADGSNIELETENSGDDIDISNATVDSSKKIIGISKGSIDAQGANLTADDSEIELQIKNGDGDIDIRDARLQSDGNIEVVGKSGEDNVLLANESGTEGDGGTYILDQAGEGKELDVKKIDTSGAEAEKGTIP